MKLPRPAIDPRGILSASRDGSIPVFLREHIVIRDFPCMFDVEVLLLTRIKKVGVTCRRVHVQISFFFLGGGGLVCIFFLHFVIEIITCNLF